MSEFKKVTVPELLELARNSEEPVEFFVTLARGSARSSKNIQYMGDGKFSLYHEHSDFEEEFHEDDIPVGDTEVSLYFRDIENSMYLY